MDGILSQEEISALLNDTGSENATQNTSLTDNEKDAIGEIANISMGTAATTLFSLVNRKVEISTPVVSLATWDDIVEAYERPCVFIRIAYTVGLDGNNLLILKENDVRATFFVDGLLLKEDHILITSLLQDFHEIELLNYKGSYDRLIFEEALDTLQVIANKRGKYCLAKYDQKEILELCSKEKMHTIIPTIQISSNPYLSLKGKLREGSIISITPTKENISELDVVIKYIKQRGYTLDTLEQLLSEARNITEK